MSENYFSLDSLPFEIIEHILKFKEISYVDVCRISAVSQLLNCISRNNKLWRIKYYQMWPSMVKMFDPLSTDWRNEFQQRIQFKRVIHGKLLELSQEFYHLDNVSNDSFYDMKSICDYHPFTDYILLGELDGIINDQNRYDNLTIKYYAEKALVYVRHMMLDTVWRTFLNSEPRPSLLKGACLIQQWCEPAKMDCTSEVSNKINVLIKIIFDEIRFVSPSHPLIKKGYHEIKNDCGEILEKSLWSPIHCRVILKCINNVLFKKLGWSCIESLTSLDGIYINEVLDKKIGIPVILGVIYETIASQLGVHLLPVSFPGRLLLKWLGNPECDVKHSWTYIDLFRSGEFRAELELNELAIMVQYQVMGLQNPAETQSWTEPVPPVTVFARMCWNAVEIGRQHNDSDDGISYLCNSLELLSILSPDDMDHKLLLTRVYMHLCINITRVISLLQEIAESDPFSTGFVAHMYQLALTALETQKIKKKTKKMKTHGRNQDTASVEFAVGMVMTHKRYDYRCVIYGWDPLCTASKDWIRRMGVDRLQFQHNQPFYNVLVSDGSNRYAAQENLEVDCSCEPITHADIGRYFESFNKDHYQPNQQKILEYPDDLAFLKKIISDNNFPQ